MLVRLIVGGLAVTVLGSCTSGGSEEVGAAHCDAVAAVVDAGGLADDLVDPFGGAPDLADHLDEVITLLDEAAAGAPDETAPDWAALLDAVRAADAELATANYDLLELSTASAEEVPALVSLGGAELTQARSRLAADARARCQLAVAEPTEALGALTSADGDVGDDLDPRAVDPAELPADQLAAVLGRSYTTDELDLVFRALSVSTVSELANALLDGVPGGEAILDDVRSRVAVRARGDDASLDALWVVCEGGDDGACDLLGFLAPVGSEYAEAAATCGGRRPASTEPCGDPPVRQDEEVGGA